MKIHFCKSNDLGGFLIRLFLFSRWNHVAIQVGDVVYEATAFQGVIRTPKRQWSWHEVETVELGQEGNSAAQKFLEAQLGKDYDWMALIALPFRRKWQAPHKWFCSELAAKALEVAGVDMPGRIPAGRVTPRDLWVALPDPANPETA